MSSKRIFTYNFDSIILLSMYLYQFSQLWNIIDECAMKLSCRIVSNNRSLTRSFQLFSLEYLLQSSCEVSASISSTTIYNWISHSRRRFFSFSADLLNISWFARLIQLKSSVFFNNNDKGNSNFLYFYLWWNRKYLTQSVIHMSIRYISLLIISLKRYLFLIEIKLTSTNLFPISSPFW